MRGLKDSFFDKWDSSKLKEFYVEHQDELFLGIRLNYINLYYKGNSICKVEERSARYSDPFRYTIANKYLDPKISSGSTKITADDLIAKYNTIKQNIDNPNNKLTLNEKIAQQLLIRNNNRNTDSDWYCVDMEYIKKRNNNTEKLFGRFDIIAVSKEKPYRTALIELKYGTGAIGGNSGVCKHTKDYFMFTDKNEFETNLKGEICSIINSYRRLVSSPFEKVFEEDFCPKPEIYFIALDNIEDQVRKKMQRYLLNIPSCSTKNFEKWVREEKIPKEKFKFFNPVFLFSDLSLSSDGSELHINNIIDHGYKRGLQD